MRAEAVRCPFCDATLRDGFAPATRWAQVLLGLMLAGCGAREEAESGGTLADTDGASTSTSAGEDDSITTVNSAGCMTYAGPSCGGDWSTSEGEGEGDTGDATSGVHEPGSTTGTGSSGGEDAATSTGTEASTSSGDSSGAEGSASESSAASSESSSSTDTPS